MTMENPHSMVYSWACHLITGWTRPLRIPGMSHQAGISEVTKESNKTSFGRNQAQLWSYNIGNRWILNIYIYITYIYIIYIYILYVIYLYIYIYIYIYIYLYIYIYIAHLGWCMEWCQASQACVTILVGGLGAPGDRYSEIIIPGKMEKKWT